jgi:type IV pilus assembly protein PilA
MRQLNTYEMQKLTRRSSAGFFLLEILVVVAVILVIAAITIPNFMKSKMIANESSAVRSLRNIATAEIVYSRTYGIHFSDNLLKLSGNGKSPDRNRAGLIDETLASGITSGYVFTYMPRTTDPRGHTTAYSVTADPQIQGSSGQRYFYTDQSGVTRSNDSVPAGPTDPPIN